MGQMYVFDIKGEQDYHDNNSFLDIHVCPCLKHTKDTLFHIDGWIYLV